MAISKNVNTIHGFEAKNAYHRVENVILETKDRLRFFVRVYNSSNTPAFDEMAYSAPYDIDKDNPIKQAYEHLKTLPEFAGATDC